MNKYIVKNCPASYRIGASHLKCSSVGGDCGNQADCIIKQIIEKLKMLQVLNIGLINEIIDMFGIEEVQDAG